MIDIQYHLLNICGRQAVSMGLWEMGGKLIANILKLRMYIMPKTPATCLVLKCGVCD